jgi:hypothetical protein
MNKALEPVMIPAEYGDTGDVDPITEFLRWRAQTYQLLMEADCAREKGYLRKAEKLLSKAHRITRNYYARK